jgi:hypothetical protein
MFISSENVAVGMEEWYDLGSPKARREFPERRRGTLRRVPFFISIFSFFYTLHLCEHGLGGGKHGHGAYGWRMGFLFSVFFFFDFGVLLCASE